MAPTYANGHISATGF